MTFGYVEMPTGSDAGLQPTHIATLLFFTQNGPKFPARLSFGFTGGVHSKVRGEEE
jgi:hypothetical protein